ncbi:hypothetical protein GCM10010116_55620 [Microbispora rosea subsp. aerata]|nr:hypothetical protein [Microbispora rosea]GGO27745.1 hypothetical protein GCM10010116_55620 [Microbispora rosea subsp. aerata]GIH56944.1 hypothetical protein Mro02_38580 [Microbispora rosea subsp. aerata]GLJ82871.1 hypothetical protein GCM10017588_15970 [Microbispora rosea subsp. aerata]
MPIFRNVITGLAVSTAMAGGALALSTTAAQAATPGTPTITSNWGHGDHWGRRGCRNAAVNRNDFRLFKLKYEKEKKVNRKNVAFASGDAVIEIDGDDDD